MGKKHEALITVDEAVKKILGSVSRLGSETVPLLEASGRILFEDIVSDINIPPFDNSAMDGFAVRYEDTIGATSSAPVSLRIEGEIQAGGALPQMTVAENRAVRIMTGAPIPAGANAVIPVEMIEEDPGGGSISVSRVMKRNENVRFSGEDIKQNQVVLAQGKKLQSADIGLLAALNRSTVKVFQKPRVGIITTGDELAELGEDLLPGKIRNSNAYALCAEVAKYNGIPVYLGIAKDTVENIRSMFAGAMEYDVVISTGGVSMGKYDFVKDVISDLGVTILIEKLNMKPGKPMTFGIKNRTLFFGLPGNPVSSIVSFIEFVRPALLLMSGAKDVKKPELYAMLDNAIHKIPGRREFIRGIFYSKSGELHVTTTGPQGSGLLRSMSMANCLIVMPEESEGCRAGDRVIIQLIHHEEIE